MELYQAYTDYHGMMDLTENLYRYVAQEVLGQAIHEEAVRLRRMTDRQLVEQFHRAAEPEMAASVPSVVAK